MRAVGTLTKIAAVPLSPKIQRIDPPKPWTKEDRPTGGRGVRLTKPVFSLPPMLLGKGKGGLNSSAPGAKAGQCDQGGNDNQCAGRLENAADYAGEQMWFGMKYIPGKTGVA